MFYKNKAAQISPFSYFQEYTFIPLLSSMDIERRKILLRLWPGLKNLNNKRLFQPNE